MLRLRLWASRGRRMCFKNLPIEFDAHGQGRLMPQGLRQPFELTPEKVAGSIPDYARANTGQTSKGNPAHNPQPSNPGPEPGGTLVPEPPPGHLVKDHMIDPVTRVAGALAFHAKCDLT